MAVVKYRITGKADQFTLIGPYTLDDGTEVHSPLGTKQIKEKGVARTVDIPWRWPGDRVISVDTKRSKALHAFLEAYLSPFSEEQIIAGSVPLFTRIEEEKIASRTLARETKILAALAELGKLASYEEGSNKVVVHNELKFDAIAAQYNVAESASPVVKFLEIMNRAKRKPAQFLQLVSKAGDAKLDHAIAQYQKNGVLRKGTAKSAIGKGAFYWFTPEGEETAKENLQSLGNKDNLKRILSRTDKDSREIQRKLELAYQSVVGEPLLADVLE